MLLGFCWCVILGPFYVACVVGHLLGEASMDVAEAPTEGWPRFLPAFSAAWPVVLAIIVYFGLGVEGSLAYECSTTWKSGAYDLLG